MRQRAARRAGCTVTLVVPRRTDRPYGVRITGRVPALLVETFDEAAVLAALVAEWEEAG